MIFLLVSVEDDSGYGIETLSHNGIAPAANAQSYFYVNNSKSASGNGTRIAAENVAHLGGGLYVVRLDSDTDNTNDTPAVETDEFVERISVIAKDITTAEIKGPETNTSGTQSKSVVMIGHDNFVEANDGASDAERIRSAYAIAQIAPTNAAKAEYGQIITNITGVTVAGNKNINNTDTVGIDITDTVSVFTTGIVETTAITTPAPIAYGILSVKNSSIEESESELLEFTVTNGLTTATAASTVNANISTYSIEVAAHQIDHINGIATEYRDAILIPYMNGNRIYNYSRLQNWITDGVTISTDDIDDAADGGTVEIKEIHNLSFGRLDDAVAPTAPNGTLYGLNNLVATLVAPVATPVALDAPTRGATLGIVYDTTFDGLLGTANYQQNSVSSMAYCQCSYFTLGKKCW